MEPRRCLRTLAEDYAAGHLTQVEYHATRKALLDDIEFHRLPLTPYIAAPPPATATIADVFPDTMEMPVPAGLLSARRRMRRKRGWAVAALAAIIGTIGIWILLQV
ncbi:MAG: hypothetical protein H6978_11440 [Gammaproteobacteria bacterium]|nr:hypothetical protein [Gammaproteobacteria bacterium]